MIDIKLLRENPELVKENIRKKFKDDKVRLVDEVLLLDSEHRKLLSQAQALRHKRNNLSEEINSCKKEGKDPKPIIEAAKKIPDEIKAIEEKTNGLEEDIISRMLQIPNIMHDSVPIGKDSSENVEVEKIGQVKEMDFEIKTHAQLVEDLNVADFDSSAKTSGTGFFFLKGQLAELNQALIRYSIDFMIKRGYLFIEPPLMIRKEICDGVVDFQFFKDMAY